MQDYAPELYKRFALTFQQPTTPGEYIKIKGKWRYLYRAVDSDGNTKDHVTIPRVINVDKSAAYPPAVEDLKEGELLPEKTELRQVKYLNNLIEQDHRFVKRRVNSGLGFGSFNTARRTIREVTRP